MSNEILLEVEKRLQEVKAELYQEIEKVRTSSATRDEAQKDELHELKESIHSDFSEVRKSFRNNAWSLIGILLSIVGGFSFYLLNQQNETQDQLKIQQTQTQKQLQVITVQQAVNTTHIGNLTRIVADHKLESNKKHEDLEDEIKDHSH